MALSPQASSFRAKDNGPTGNDFKVRVARHHEQCKPSTHMNPTSILAIGPLGTPEMIIIGVLILVLFGAKKLPTFARSLGKSMGEFKKARTEFEQELQNAQDEAVQPKIQSPQEKRQPVANVEDS